MWVLHGHQATLHTTFVDVCMHVHVSCQPASYQVLMRPAGSVLGPNQTGETAQSWLSFRLVHPTSPKPPAHPPSPPDILENHGRLSTQGRFGNGMFVKIYPVSQIPWPRPEFESPRLKPQTCLFGFLPLPCFLHLQQLWWCWGLL